MSSSPAALFGHVDGNFHRAKNLIPKKNFGAFEEPELGLQCRSLKEWMGNI
jgi:hypothetical protein